MVTIEGLPEADVNGWYHIAVNRADAAKKVHIYFDCLGALWIRHMFYYNDLLVEDVFEYRGDDIVA